MEHNYKKGKKAIKKVIHFGISLNDCNKCSNLF